MPQYKIKCKGEKCNHSELLLDNYEELKKALKKPCPKCGEKSLYNHIDSANFVLKGAGWTGNSMLGKA